MWPLCWPPRRLPAPRISRIERRHAKAAAEIAELPDGRQPLLGHRRQRLRGRREQERVGRAIGTAHAPAELVQLREPVAVRAVDDDRVGVGDIEAVLDDRRRQQDVGPPLHEAKHRALELVFAHLAVADGDPRFGHEALQQRPDREDRFDAVVYEVHLTAARQLVADRTLDHRRVEPHDRGLNRQPILGRRFDHRHVADADKRHVERSWDRRGRHGQDVHLLLQLLDALLVRHPEPLFLVHDEQAEVTEAGHPLTGAGASQPGCRACPRRRPPGSR